MEVRYIVFSVEETRNAIVSFVRIHYHNKKENVRGIEIVGPDESPSVVVHLHTTPINIATSDVVSLLLLYCRDHRVPVPLRSQKKVQRSAGGLTLVLTTDMIEGGVPLIVDDRITYGDNATTQELSVVRQELTRAIARAEDAERRVTEIGARVATAEKTRANLAAIEPVAGLWVRIGRLLVNR